MQVFVIAVAFIAGFLFIFGTNLVIADLMEANRLRVRKRLEEEARRRVRERAERAKKSNKELYQTAEGLSESQFQPTYRERFNRFVEQSGMAITPRQVAAMAMVLFVLPVPAGVVWNRWELVAILAPIAAVLPVVLVSQIRKRRLDKLLSQLPDAFDLMSRTMKAGQTIPQALQTVGDELAAPVSDEFRYCYEQQNLGLTPEAALRELARRTGLLELKIFVLAVGIHGQTGGNLSTLLDKLSTLIRSRSRIRGSIKALTAEGRMQAIILLGLPPMLLAIMMVLNRKYAMILFEHPMLLVGMFTSMALGALWMRKIVNFDF